MGQATCIEEINSDQSWLQILKDGVLGILGAGRGDIINLLEPKFYI